MTAIVSSNVQRPCSRHDDAIVAACTCFPDRNGIESVTTTLRLPTSVTENGLSGGSPEDSAPGPARCDGCEGIPSLRETAKTEPDTA